MSTQQTKIGTFLFLAIVLAVATIYVFPIQEAMASLLNINGNKVASNNQNKGKDNNNCIGLCK